MAYEKVLTVSGTSDTEVRAGKKATSFTQSGSSLKEVRFMTNNFKTLFFLRKEKTDRDKGLSPLYLRLTCEKRTEISLNKWVPADKWNPKKQCIVGNSPEAKAINGFLKTVEVRLHEIHRNLLDKGELITAESLKTHFLGRGEKQRTLLEVFDYQLTQIRSKLGKGYTISTLRKYQYLRNHLASFIVKSSGTSDMFLSKLNLYLIKEFQSYLMTDREGRDGKGEITLSRGCEFNAALKYVKMLRAVTNVALSFKWVDPDPFTGFKEKFQDVSGVSQ